MVGSVGTLGRGLAQRAGNIGTGTAKSYVEEYYKILFERSREQFNTCFSACFAWSKNKYYDKT